MNVGSKLVFRYQHLGCIQHQRRALYFLARNKPYTVKRIFVDDKIEVVEFDEVPYQYFDRKMFAEVK